MNDVTDFVGSAHLFSSALTDVLQARLLREAGGAGLSLSKLKLLQLLAVARTQTVGELSAFLGVSAAAASKMVEKLVQSGWLNRAAGTRDRRAAHVSLTQQSQKLLAVYESIRQQNLPEIFRKASPRQLRALARLMDQITVEILNHSARAGDICLHCGIYFRDKCLVRDLDGRTCFYRQRTELAAERKSKLEAG
jgi:MarR family transcriptional regulator, transcriptional regulator for hemolysin